MKILRLPIVRALVELYLDLRNGVRAARRQRLMVEAAHLDQAAYVAARPHIVRVGEIRLLPAGGFAIEGDWQFWFPCSASAAMRYPLTREDLDGTKRIYGYTLADLKQFHARRAEFNIDA